MKIGISSIRYAGLFAGFSALMVANGPAQSAAVTTLFAMGELGATGILCSLIVRQYRRRSMADSVLAAVAGYTISHIGMLAALYFGLAGSPAPGTRAASTLLWMELTLRVGLIVVLASASFGLMKPIVRKATLRRLRLRKFAATAGDYVI